MNDHDEQLEDAIRCWVGETNGGILTDWNLSVVIAGSDADSLDYVHTGHGSGHGRLGLLHLALQETQRDIFGEDPS